MNKVLISDVIAFLEEKAPPIYQESYDNSGLIVGDKSKEATGALICLDSTEEVIDEAIKTGANLVIAHHPIVFTGLKRFTGNTYVERVIMKAIKHDIAVYSIHTNLDNVMHGVNAEIARRIGLNETRILAPKSDILQKLVVFVPADHEVKVRAAMFDAGAGEIGNYDHCSFRTEGNGTFRGNEGTDPFVGKIGEDHNESEYRLEVLVGSDKLPSVLKSMHSSHPYEEVAYDIYPLKNRNQEIGSGMIGLLSKEMSEEEFLAHLKNSMALSMVKFTPTGKRIKHVAICGGSGSFLLSSALAQNADAFVTADYKYHQFFDGEGKITICDIGHYESERFTIDLLGAWLMEKFSNFAVRLTEHNTNPINYF